LFQFQEVVSPLRHGLVLFDPDFQVPSENIKRISFLSREEEPLSSITDILPLMDHVGFSSKSVGELLHPFLAGVAVTATRDRYLQTDLVGQDSDLASVHPAVDSGSDGFCGVVYVWHRSERRYRCRQT